MSFSDSYLGRAFTRLGYKKNIDRLLEAAQHKEGLAKNLGARDLVTLGVAGIIGAGIFVLVGKGAALAGNAVIFAFIIAAAICVVAGYAYAELAAAIPASGSAYAYLYTALGELPGWLVAWALVLEYAVGAIAVAIGWRNNFIALIDQIGHEFSNLAASKSYFESGSRYTLTHSPLEHAGNLAGFIDLPAIGIVLFCTLLLCLGTKESARFTAVLVAIKVSILMLAIGVGFYLAAESNFDNLFNNGLGPFEFSWSHVGPAISAIMGAAAIMFFAYIGFDSVSTTAEETKNPKKDLPIGILGSLAITTLLYILAATALVGAADWHIFQGDGVEATKAVGEPFGYVFEKADKGWFVDSAAFLVRIGAIIGTTSVLLVLILGGVRVFFNMSRDGLLPAWMSRVSSRGAPVAATVFYGGMTLAFAGFLDLGKAVDLVNIGTLFAFLMVIIAAWVFRLRRPDVPRPLTMPLWSPIKWKGRPILPIFSILGLAGIGYLIFSLGKGGPVDDRWFTQIAALAWTGIGLLVYAFYGIHRSNEARERAGLATSAAAPAKAPKLGKTSKPGKASTGAYTHNGYTLYKKDIELRNGGTRPIFFFAKAEPVAGQAIPLPDGYRVGVNDRTGLPYLAKA